MARRQVRYWLFRKQNEVEGGAKARGAPRGLYRRFEALPTFVLAGGYKTFAQTWDVDREDPFKIIPRNQSITEEWNTHLIETAKPVRQTTKSVMARLDRATQ